MLIRVEKDNDRDAVHAVNVSAFPTPFVADLVDALRDQTQPIVLLVAEEAGEVIGHIMFSPVTLDGSPELKMMGLAPMAVSPQHQRKGIGSAHAQHIFNANEAEQLMHEILKFLSDP